MRLQKKISEELKQEFLHGPMGNTDLNPEDIEYSELDTEELASTPEAENEPYLKKRSWNVL